MKLKVLLLILCTFFYVHAGDELPSLYKISAPEGFKSGKEAFSEVLKIVKKEFYDSENLKEEDLYYAAIKGILRRLSPPESPNQGKIWSSEERKKVYDDLKEMKAYFGVKFVFDKKDGSLTVTNILKESPALNILKINDRIMRIDGEPLKGLEGNDFNQMLTGGDNREVALTVVRDIEVLNLKVKLKEVRVYNCIAATVDGVGYLRIKSFSENISGEMKEHLEKFRKENLKALIIDLRDNTGGYFSEGVKSAELFLKRESKIVSVLRAGGQTSHHFSRNLVPYDFQLAILIDGRTASSSEVLAAAMSENKAVLIGENSYGKAIIEKPFELSNGYSIKFSVGAMYSPKGKTWHEDGLSPDIKSQTEFGKTIEEDIAVLKAVKYLKGN